jgi:hypothetical protein
MTMLPNKYYTECMNRGPQIHTISGYILSVEPRICSCTTVLISFWVSSDLTYTSSQKGGSSDLRFTNRVWKELSPILSQLWPLNKLATNIFVVGKKVEAFHG